MRKIFLFFTPLLLNACVEFEFPPCDVGNLKEYPHFENSRTFKLYDSKEHKIISTKDRLEKTGKASYKDSSGNALRTCDISGRSYVEALNPKYSTYELNLIEEMSDKSLLLSSVMIDKKTLDDLGIHYQIVSRNKDFIAFNLSPELAHFAQDFRPSATETLLIDESDTAKRSLAIEHLSTASILLRTYKE